MKKEYEKAVKLIAKYKNEDAQIRNCNGNAELIEIVKKINSRAKNTGELSVNDFCLNLLRNRLRSIAKALPAEGYSMGSIVSVLLLNGKVRGADDRRSNYANSCKYSPTHGSVILKLTPAELRCTRVIANLVTYIYPGQKGKVKKCYWYAGSGSKQHFQLVKKEGFVCGDYHATNKDAAKAGFERNEKERKRLEAWRKLQGLNEKQKAANYKKALRKQYSYADSIAVNCEGGTDAFILRCGLDRDKKYRGSFLVKTANEKSRYSLPYVERMIKSKV
jgi:hypothetical protein